MEGAQITLLIILDRSIFKTLIKRQSGKLKRQPGDFPQRGKSPYFLFSLPDCFIIITVVEMISSLIYEGKISTLGGWQNR
jgi:hypothetical protein